MGKRRNDDELFQTLSQTRLLVGNLEVPEGEEFSLDNILAEFGQGGAKPAPKAEPTAPTEEVPVAQVAREKADPVAETPGDEDMKIAPPRRAKVLQFPTAAPLVEEREEEAPPVAPEKEEPPRPQMTIEDVMAATVDAVLEDETDGILREPEPIAKRVSAVVGAVQSAWQGWTEKLHGRRAPAEPVPPEPDMEQAYPAVKRRCKRLVRQTTLSGAALLALVLVTVVDTWFPAVLGAVWAETVALRGGAVAGLLLAECLLAAEVWRRAIAALQKKSFNCECAALLVVAVVVGQCVYGVAIGALPQLPAAASAGLAVWLCLVGRLLWALSRRDSFRLADLGGRPPYGVAMTSAGACKQKGRMEGFYSGFEREDPAALSQGPLLLCLLSVCTVLAGVICYTGGRMEEYVTVWSVLLCAGLPVGLPLCGKLSVWCLNRRLGRSGCAVAGYAGARAICGGGRMVVTDNDLFPPGTVTLNGMKVYGEEMSKVISYGATVVRAAESQLSFLFDQLLSAEGGQVQPYSDLRFYEEGGVEVTIHGESVTVGSEYFMRKRHVALPRELKVKTGLFLAVDGQLIAIFAIKYQPSRNVEWALRALRRSHIEPVLAVRSVNITPGLLKKRFGQDGRAVYPEVATRLALSDLAGETVERGNAILYREGLMPYAETVIGARRCRRTTVWSTWLAWLGSICGVALGYYLMGLAAYSAMSAGYVLLFSVLWLLPAVLLGDMTRRF